ncbi:MAG: cupin domain-containing protein [Thermoleophilaceae bacterium]|nr:cupin domain-containing protein [Thermoleophilaceae bacterium]
MPILLAKGAHVEPPELAHGWGEDTDLAFIGLAHQLHAAGAELAIGTHDPVIREALLASFESVRFEMLLGVRPEMDGHSFAAGNPSGSMCPTAATDFATGCAAWAKAVAPETAGARRGQGQEVQVVDPASKQLRFFERPSSDYSGFSQRRRSRSRTAAQVDYPPPPRIQRAGMDAFQLYDLIAGLDTSRHDFAEFFRAETLSLTAAFWPASGVDDQQPHSEDEVYFVVAGRGRLRVADEDRDIEPGTVVYVAAGVEHRFHSITDDLEVLVFWSPPRQSNADQRVS